MYDSSGDLNGCHRAISQAKRIKHLMRKHGTIVAYPDRTAFLGDYFRIAGFVSKWTGL
jgi:hypothetical protein